MRERRVRVRGCTPTRPCFRGARRRRLHVCASQMTMKTTMMLKKKTAVPTSNDKKAKVISFAPVRVLHQIRESLSVSSPIPAG